MAHRPMSRPDPFDPPGQGGSPISLGGNEDSEPDELSLSELATELSAHGGGALSADLALDLVLNEIVEHARLATGATAAAIALARGDEIVCRATTGANAPDLGVQLNVHSGLSGACVQSKKWQRCDDTESDSRVNAEVCRSLGVRSILVFPVTREDELLGVFEIFSPRPNAFSDREIQTLEALSRSIVNNVDRASDIPTQPAPVSATSLAVAAIPETTAEVEEVSPFLSDAASAEIPEVESAQTEHSAFNAPLAVEDVLPETEANAKVLRRDPWMTVLTLVVVALALFLGWMLGYVRSPRAAFVRRAGTSARTAPQAAPATPAENAPSTSTAVRTPEPPIVTNPKPAAPEQAKVSSGPPVGGLEVYEKGKVIFETPPSSNSVKDSNSQPVTVPSNVADQYVLLRVEPEYPEAAREQHIQGSVALAALVGKDGTVEKLSTISGDPQLAAAATDAVRQWRFKPVLRNGSAEEFQTQINVSFRLP